MDRGKLEIRVSHHPSGRYTLTEKSTGPTADVMSDGLFGNGDPASFYRAVARHIAQRAAQGWNVDYEDTNVDLTDKVAT